MKLTNTRMENLWWKYKTEGLPFDNKIPAAAVSDMAVQTKLVIT